MANKNKGTRQGGKYTGSHTTVTVGGGVVCDIANVLPGVTKISIGIILAGQGTVPKRRVKVIRQQGALLLKVRDNGAVQEIRIYADDLSAVQKGIVDGAERADMAVSFPKEVF